MLQPLFVALALAAAPIAPQPPLLNPQIDFDGYRALIDEVRPYRLARLIDWDTFIAAAAEDRGLSAALSM